MSETVHIPWAEDKASSELEGILPQLVLGMPRSLGAGSRLSIVASKQMQDIGALEFHSLVSLPLFVNEEWKSDSRFLAKCSRISSITKSHGCQSGAMVPDGLLVFAQLRDVLAAEDSAVMTQKNNHRRLTEPQGAETQLLSVCIREDDHRKPAIEGHELHSRRASQAVKSSVREQQVSLSIWHLVSRSRKLKLTQCLFEAQLDGVGGDR